VVLDDTQPPMSVLAEAKAANARMIIDEYILKISYVKGMNQDWKCLRAVSFSDSIK
jgi:hypothetical protein